jgi:glutathione synthase/RimK-type ligase-like ATP-grasp enzyme
MYDTKNKRILVNEVNGSPGTKINKVVGFDVNLKAMDFFVNKFGKVR